MRPLRGALANPSPSTKGRVLPAHATRAGMLRCRACSNGPSSRESLETLHSSVRTAFRDGEQTCFSRKPTVRSFDELSGEGTESSLLGAQGKGKNSEADPFMR